MQLFLAVTDDLHIFKSNGQFSVLILLDLAAVFNTADHSLLLETLSPLGYQHATLLTSPYLTGHVLSVSFAGSSSSP